MAVNRTEVQSRTDRRDRGYYDTDIANLTHAQWCGKLVNPATCQQLQQSFLHKHEIVGGVFYYHI